MNQVKTEIVPFQGQLLVESKLVVEGGHVIGLCRVLDPNAVIIRQPGQELPPMVASERLGMIYQQIVDRQVKDLLYSENLLARVGIEAYREMADKGVSIEEAP